MRKLSVAAICLRLAAPLLALTVSLMCTFAEASCIVADPVRLVIDGVEYRIPAELQPYYSPVDAIKTRDYFPKNFRTKQYCQLPEAIPAAVRTFSFRGRELAAWAEQKPRFDRLAGVYPLSIHSAPNAPPRVLTGGEVTADGLFRRINHNKGFYELVSTQPLLFGAPISANCGPAGTHKPSISCLISGQLPVGSLISIRIHDTTHPPDTWPETMAQVELFISLLTHQENRQR